jgi:flagellar P-ring protein precursor FlgI
MGRLEKGFLLFIWMLALLMVADFARAERIKDIANIAGVRENQLVGYGIVVGLDGSGDQTTQTPFTVQSMISMLGAMGVSMPPGQSLQLKNVAAVMVTAALPAFGRTGQVIDVTVSSIGNAKSLKGGTLVMTPLKGADGQVYAVAQGNLAVAGAGGSAGGAKVTVNHLAVGRIPNGATIEREVATTVGQGDYAIFDLMRADFTTAQRVADAINKLEPGMAEATDSRQIRVKLPPAPNRISFLGKIEALEVTQAPAPAKVIVNSRTGSVVMNRAVALDNFAVAHGNLSVAVSGDGGGSVDIKQEGGGLLNVKASPSLTDVIKALNSIGATPLDLVAILQAMKSAGALRAELEII